MHRTPASVLGLEWLGEMLRKSRCQPLGDPSSSSALQLSMCHVAATQLQTLDAADVSAFPHGSHPTPPYGSHQIQLSQPLLVLSASPRKRGQEALQMLPNRFRKSGVRLHIPLIICSKDQSKTTKMEPEEILVWRSRGVKASDVSKRLDFHGATVLLPCPLL